MFSKAAAQYGDQKDPWEEDKENFELALVVLLNQIHNFLEKTAAKYSFCITEVILSCLIELWAIYTALILVDYLRSMVMETL